MSGLRALPVGPRVDEVIATDVVIVGSGVAGLSTALALGSHSVQVLTKTDSLAGGSSLWAQGGIAAAMSEEDSAAEHAADTLAAGAGLSDPDAVDLLTRSAGRHILQLVARGARFDHDDAGRLILGREGAHSHRRILHANGDATGAEMVRALVAALVAEKEAREDGSLRVFKSAFAQDLVLDDAGHVTGVMARHSDGRLVLHAASAVVLATGGTGQLFRHTTNPTEATGDGLAMAARAGAHLADLPFIQFHPTALNVEADPLPLLTEALRGEGAILIDDAGERFMLAEHPLAELAPRDVVARAIWRRQQQGQHIALDATKAVGEAFPTRFPTVWAACRRHGIDPRHEPMPVTPAAHYAMAGIATDDLGRSSLPGLWACGEVSATGVHGANRLASNSLLEALVFGARVAEDIAVQASADLQGEVAMTVRARAGLVRREPWLGESTPEHLADLHERVRTLMWRQVGLERTRSGLVSAEAWLAGMAEQLPAEPSATHNLITIGRLVAAGALVREESRGAHCRLDHPQSRPAAAQRSFWKYAPESEGLPLVPALGVRCETQREIA